MNVRLATHAMGTRFEIVLAGDDETRLRAIGEEAIEVIEDWHRRLSLFDKGSLVSHMNRCASDRPVRVDDEMFELLAACAEVHTASGGAFDISVAPLMRHWGFHPDVGNPEPGGNHVGAEHLELDHEARTIRFRRPGMSIDLGGIGKGHALDAAAAVLREHGVERALLHGGTSTIVAIGSPPGDEPSASAGWRIAISRDGESPTVRLCDTALSVSAPHGRTIDAGGAQLGHVINPATKSPATGVALAAAVGPSARLTDAWSTALLVLGSHPADLSLEITSLIIHQESRDDHWSIDGPDRMAFTIPERRGFATEARL